MTQKTKDMKFEKVVEWDEHLSDSKYTDLMHLIDGFIYMIPIIGQAYWIGHLVFSLKNRKVYWRKVK